MPGLFLLLTIGKWFVQTRAGLPTSQTNFWHLLLIRTSSSTARRQRPGPWPQRVAKSWKLGGSARSYPPEILVARWSIVNGEPSPRSGSASSAMHSFGTGWEEANPRSLSKCDCSTQSPGPDVYMASPISVLAKTTLSNWEQRPCKLCIGPRREPVLQSNSHWTVTFGPIQVTTALRLPFVISVHCMIPVLLSQFLTWLQAKLNFTMPKDPVQPFSPDCTMWDGNGKGTVLFVIMRCWHGTLLIRPSSGLSLGWSKPGLWLTGDSLLPESLLRAFRMWTSSALMTRLKPSAQRRRASFVVFRMARSTHVTCSTSQGKLQNRSAPGVSTKMAFSIGIGNVPTLQPAANIFPATSSGPSWKNLLAFTFEDGLLKRLTLLLCVEPCMHCLTPHVTMWISPPVCLNCTFLLMGVASRLPNHAHA